MNEGDIVLADLVQSDGQTKTRPALVLRKMPPFGDGLICGISSQLRQEVPGFDEVVLPDALNRLRTPSVIRLGFLQVIPEYRVSGTVGRVPDSLRRDLLHRLTEYLNR